MFSVVLVSHAHSEWFTTLATNPWEYSIFHGAGQKTIVKSSSHKPDSFSVFCKAAPRPQRVGPLTSEVGLHGKHLALSKLLLISDLYL